MGPLVETLMLHQENLPGCRLRGDLEILKLTFPDMRLESPFDDLVVCNSHPPNWSFTECLTFLKAFDSSFKANLFSYSTSCLKISLCSVTEKLWPWNGIWIPYCSLLADSRVSILNRFALSILWGNRRRYLQRSFNCLHLCWRPT